jgi:hypothetical protein
MRENEKDASTRRFNTDDFDCTPPPGAMDELLRPKRARMFRPPEPPPAKPSRLEEARKFVNTAVLLAMGVAFIFAMFAMASRKTAPVSTLPPPYSYGPAPTPAPAPAARAEVTIQQPNPVVRRAELAVKRAQLVGLPVGWQGREQMPDGSIVSVRYMGEVGYFDHLPRNPALGDMWKVTSSGAAWVWTTPAGFAAPAWVDP